MIYDISWPISPLMTSWPGTEPPWCEPVLSTDRGDAVNFSRWAMAAHAGTHVDAPRHFLDDGQAVEELPLDALVGPCTLVDLAYVRTRHICAADLRRVVHEPVERLLLRTANSLRQPPAGAFRHDYVALADDAVDWLLAIPVRAVGIDGLSIEPFDAESHYVHRRLLGAGVAIIEGLRLADVPSGRYTLSCLPLALVGSDGAPARAALLAP